MGLKQNLFRESMKLPGEIILNLSLMSLISLVLFSRSKKKELKIVPLFNTKDPLRMIYLTLKSWFISYDGK